MDVHVYEIISLTMRYVFAFLGIMIVYRAFSWLFKDRKEKHRRLRQLPDAGNIGEFVVTGMPESDTVKSHHCDIEINTSIPVPWDGSLGFSRSNDVVVPVDGINKRALDFSFVNGEGLYIYPVRGVEVQVDGENVPLHNKSKIRMYHNSVLSIGGISLKLRLFAGLEARRSAVFQHDDDDTSTDAVSSTSDNYSPAEDSYNTAENYDSSFPEMPADYPYQSNEYPNDGYYNYPSAQYMQNEPEYTSEGNIYDSNLHKDYPMNSPYCPPESSQNDWEAWNKPLSDNTTECEEKFVPRRRLSRRERREMENETSEK